VDHLILLVKDASDATPDVAFINTPALLRRLVNVEYSIGDIKARYEYLERSGRADQIRKNPKVQVAIQKQAAGSKKT